MFDFAWTELALIAVVALIVIGPKDLPRVMRTVGFWVRKARAVAHEFQGSLEQMARDAELDEVREHVEKATRFNFDETIAKHVDPHGELKTALDDPMLHNPMAELTKTDVPLTLLPTAEPEPPPAAFLPPPESTAPAPESHAEPPLPEPPPVKLHEGGR